MSSVSAMEERVETVRSTLREHGQEHLLRFFDELNDAQRAELLDDIESVDFAPMSALIEQFLPADAGSSTLPDDLEPAPFYPATPSETYDARAFMNRGRDLIRAGRIAAFTVAGGQGTRLGWRGPKGTFPATPVTGKSLFQTFAEQIIAAERVYGVTIPWYIMTSAMNDADTRAFFADNNNFGLSRRNIFMFPQGTMPSFDDTAGKLLLADRHRLALNPDGHGGALRALRDSGALEDMRARGVEHISYFQVDNPLVNVIDPLFVGLHAAADDSSAEMSSKMVRKTDPAEKVGVFCRSGGRTRVIEYSDLPDELAAQRDASGALRFNAGSIAVHMLSVAFVESIAGGDGERTLPWHRAHKKVAHIDPDTGEYLEPEQPNAIKLELFIFDALPLADASIVLETQREEEFAPIKNRSGTDSPDSSHTLQTERAARWLEAVGVAVPRDEHGRVRAQLEISPLAARSPEDLKRLELPGSISPGEVLAL